MEFSDDDLAYLLAMCEGRVLTSQFVKSLVPAINVFGDIARAGILADRVRDEQAKRAESKAKKAVAPKEA